MRKERIKKSGYLTEAEVANFCTLEEKLQEGGKMKTLDNHFSREIVEAIKDRIAADELLEEEELKITDLHVSDDPSDTMIEVEIQDKNSNKQWFRTFLDD